MQALNEESVSGFDLSAPSEQQWFALRVRPRCEQVVATSAVHKGFETFVPVYEARRKWSDRYQTVELPLFPGYIFSRLKVEHRLPLLMIPNVLHFVGIGRTPVPVDAEEINAIQTAVRSGLLTEPWPFLTVGQKVRLEEGPLAGIEGVLVEVRKQRRLVVSVSLLGRSIAVVIDRHWVRPVDRLHCETGPFIAAVAG